ncbi:HAD hydrolase family protein [Streptomyces decoyicus]|uniref:HAD hydrolase family protein n=1 Tax=Streptomyces decoyicus TaxID=249567 RepID=UPI00069E7D53|nr:HAD hydrolase family protein [Streptomyces decoyicus]KOG38760.1 hydrolase [Streptomyces decoyicus]QZY17152.1 HAD hydrolase family protein [Streptomyces decoyicus]
MTDAPATPLRAPETAVAPRLIATDLDGTLLHDDKTVSDRTIAALAAAEQAGIEVFFVTGRPARWMGVVSDHVHGHGLAICANGAAVVDLHRGGRIVEVSPLERTVALAVVDALRSAAPGTSFAVERTGGIHYEPQYPPLLLDPAAAVAPAEKLLADDFVSTLCPEANKPDATRGPDGRSAAAHSPSDSAGPAFPDQPVIKLLAHHPELDPDTFLQLARTAAGDLASFTRSSPTALLEISGPGVSKAGTLARCCAERGISPDEVVAFGDMPNDIEMLSWAGTSYAMANAHPDVLAATTGRTASNNDDGVAAVIERILHDGGPRGDRSH